MSIILFTLNAFLQESGLVVDYRPWCRRPKAQDWTPTTFRAIHMTASQVIDNWGVYPGSIRTYSWRHHYDICLCIEFAGNEVNNEALAVLLGFDGKSELLNAGLFEPSGFIEPIFGSTAKSFIAPLLSSGNKASRKDDGDNSCQEN
ncbi:hypothetical protein GJ496_005351 [Pomphorhynchus laevis]|nr:hypothetical protein GJ496_005984 [Pomphorhynchus laevis]KAI0980857.1 hypothetical protein GJ496_005069 [Pomphorhynchus laevis]KAI0981512.1 hypothetical protein GJ496_005351 [Pomphorhynchus laevis]